MANVCVVVVIAKYSAEWSIYCPEWHIHWPKFVEKIFSEHRTSSVHFNQILERIHEMKLAKHSCTRNIDVTSIKI